MNSFSVFSSRADVASSNNNKSDYFIKDLAMQILCFSPPEILNPFSSIFVSKPLSKLLTNLSNLHKLIILYYKVFNILNKDT